MRPALEMATSHALLRAVASARRPATVWARRPEPTVAFGRLDALRPGFREAVAAARDHGFDPVLRLAGGHAAAYDGGCLVIDEAAPEADALAGMQARFVTRGDALARALCAVGVDARVGEVAGEYCPGAQSVNAGGRVKLAGTAQRVVRGGYLFATVVVVERSDAIRAVLEAVYAALAIDWEPSTAGAVADEVPGMRVDAVAAALGVRLGPPPAGLDATALEAAHAL